MLNIPESVKALFKLDGVHKNFRVHFPNGEHADLTNADVVQESVVFTESLCSQNVLRFGLTEASSIEFETVGVPNMRGQKIECAIEISVATLTAAQIADIEAGEWDGELTDGYFSVPYGTFVVDKCPRNHGAMTHRRVTAYSATAGKNPYEQAKLAVMLPGEYYTPDIRKLALSAAGWNDKGYMERQGYTKSRVQYMETRTIPINTYTFTDTNGNRIPVAFLRDVDIRNGYVLPLDNIYSIELNGRELLTKATLVERLEQQFADFNITDPSPFASWEKVYEVFEVEPYEVAYMPYTTTPRVLVAQDNYAVYPWRDIQNSGISDTFNVWLPRNLRLTFTVSGQGYSHDILDAPPIDFYEYSGIEASSRLKVQSTAEEVRTDTGKKRKYYSFTDAYDLTDFLNGFFELSGQFLRAGRNGNFEAVSLESDIDMTLTPEDYSEMWWDEYDIDPVGTIAYAYKDEAGETQEREYPFGSGRSRYDMRDNEMLLNLQNATAESVEAMLDAQFVPQLANIGYTPVELSMKGLPYMEAGDHITIEAADGTEVTTYALELTISGIQHLTAEIVSVGGEAMEE